MRSAIFLAIALVACLTSALQSPHERAKILPKRERPKAVRTKDAPRKRQTTGYLNNVTAPFAVNGSAIPDVDFNIGESYAGTLSIDENMNNTNRLWFWFFPSENPAACDEIVLWLNGGPGCSSLDGLFQENGPFQWYPGTYSPIQNPYSWVNLTNMVWVDQPIGTGFSPAAPGAPAEITSEDDISRDFLGFWKNFMTTFGLEGRRVYLTGESYAGQYIPYISAAMLATYDTTYYNVAGMQINDPSLNHDDTIIEAPAVMALNYFQNVFNLNETFMTQINQRADDCGYTAFMENALQFPPKGKIPTAPSSNRIGCDVWGDIVTAAIYVNPCFNFYHILDYCPFLWDELGFPSLGWGPSNYFNRSDVQMAINAPPTNYAICGDNTLFPHGDQSEPSSLGPIPAVIERTNNVIIGHGALDFLLIANGTLVSIQNMTWNGAQGFQTPISATKNFFVPYHAALSQSIQGIENQAIPKRHPVYDTAGAGLLGYTHTERGLTFVTVDHAGHEIPEYVPGASYRHLEFLLGRISSLEQMGDFTTQTGNFTGTAPPSPTST